MTIDQHVTLAARLWIIYSTLILIGSFATTMFFLFLFRHEKAEHYQMLMLPPHLQFALECEHVLFLSLVSLPGIVGGIALFKRQRWARMLLLVLGFLNLVSFPPIGTALGVYTIWLLFKRTKTLAELKD